MNIFNFFAGSFRLMLFASTLILLVMAMLMGSQALSANDLYVMLGTLDWSSKANWFLIGALYLAGVALIGLWGAFYNHRGTIRVFGWLTALNSLLCVLVFIGLPDLESTNSRFDESLFKAQEKYNWNPRILSDSEFLHASTIHDGFDSPDKVLRDPTKLWDTLQGSYFCCGLNDKREWYQYSPIPHSLPRSCCLPHEQSTSESDGMKYCKEPGSLWKERPCIDIIRRPVILIELTLIILFLFNLVFSMFAFMVACCSSYGDPATESYIREPLAYPSQMIGSSLHNGYTEPHLIIHNNIPPCSCPPTTNYHQPPSYIQSENMYPSLDEKQRQSMNYGSLR